MNGTNDLLYKVSKPARYTGAEWNSTVKNWDDIDIKIALAFPDVYEIGMSNLGLAVLYDILNGQRHVLAERVFTPWIDMEAEIRQAGIELFSLESQRPLMDFDVVGFSLGHELTYTNVLNMLDLAGIPVLACDRNQTHPLIIGGGVCVLNPEPMADFFDLFVIGDGEEVVVEIADVLREAKKSGIELSRSEMLKKLAQVSGIYVPSLYKDSYNTDGTLAALEPLSQDVPSIIKRRIVQELPPPPVKYAVPYIQVVHDRAVVEIQRGCTQGCRFCQAGIVYRPLRHRTSDQIVEAADQLIDNCGYDELSLLSLSTGDYPGIEELVATLAKRYQRKRVSISIPSLRLDTFSVDLAESLKGRKKTGFTFAPEAGSQRLRNVINKHLSDEVLMQTVAMTLAKGWSNLKLYFMVGLPTETLDDVKAIVDMVHRIRRIRTPNGRSAQIKVNVSTFVPKPHTPFQWVGLDSSEQLEAKQDILRQGLRKGGIQLSWHDPKSSLLEALMARGDRRVGKAIHRAWQLGCRYDSWSEHFRYDLWQQAFDETDVDPGLYAHRKRDLDEVLPWSHIDIGVELDFLRREYQRAIDEKDTPDCSRGVCIACGLQVSGECQARNEASITSV